MDKYGNCPECGSSWDGGEIPEKYHEYYGPPYKWSRLIGIETPDYDGVSYWKCPDCGAVWDRFTNHKVNNLF
jgi:hypothetical protein